MAEEVKTAPPETPTPPPADGPTPLKTEGTPPAEAPKEPAKVSSPPAPPVVPIKYELKAPEGSFLDAKDVEKIADIARAQGLSQKDAAAFLVEQNKQIDERIDRQSQAWLEEAQNDKEIGGAAFEENALMAKRLVDHFGSDRLKTEMARLGYGNHPELVRLFTKIGKHFANDKAVFPGPTGSGKVEKSLEEVFYPTMFEKKE